MRYRLQLAPSGGPRRAAARAHGFSRAAPAGPAGPATHPFHTAVWLTVPWRVLWMLLLMLVFLWLATRSAGAVDLVRVLQFSDGTLTGHSVFSTAANVFAAVDTDGAVRFYDTGGQVTRTLKKKGEVILSAAFSPDGRSLIAGTQSGDVLLWDLGSGESRIVFTVAGASANKVAWLPDPDRGVAASEDGLPGPDNPPSVFIFTLDRGRLLQSFRAYVRDGFDTLCVSKDGARMTLLGLLGYRGAACVVDTATGKVISALQHPSYPGGWLSVCLSPDGNTLATGQATDIVLWDLKLGKPLRVLKGHTGWVVSLAFSSDGRRLASGSGDGTARVWDIATGTEVGRVRFDGARTVVNSVSFSPDGSLLLAATWADHVLARLPKGR